MDIGGMVRAARRGAGLTQIEAATRAGVSARALWSVEQGQGHMETLRLVAAAIEFRIAGLPVGKTLGARIAAARAKRKWSQEKLAAKAGVSIPTVASVEDNSGQVASLAKILAVISTQVRQRKNERANWESGRRDVRYTPEWLLDEIVAAFGPISLDPCYAEGSFVQADRHITAEQDALVTPWSGRLAFMNPPYSAAAVFLDRAYIAWVNGECETVIALVPVRTNTRVFHERCAGVADVVFMKGRPNFVNPFAPNVSGQIPFGTCLIVWGAPDRQSVRDFAARLGARVMERDDQEIAAA